MTWILFESLLALAVGVAIVWWTMGPRRKPRADAAADEKADNGRGS